MRTIEPCCASKQFMFLRDSIGENGKTQFQAYEDMSLTEFLPALLTRYTETNMLIVAPTIPDQAFDIINLWLNKEWARNDGKGTLNCLSQLTIVADFSKAVSPKASHWLTDNPFGARLKVVDRKQEDTALLLPDIAVTGPMNFKYGRKFVCDVTTIPDEVSALWKRYAKLAEPIRNKRKKSDDKVKED